MNSAYKSKSSQDLKDPEKVYGEMLENLNSAPYWDSKEV